MHQILESKHKQHLILSIIIVIINGILLSTTLNSPSSNYNWFLLFVGVIIWIRLIVLSVEINKITNNSTTLIIFSIFTLWIAVLIVSIIERNKNMNLLLNNVNFNNYNMYQNNNNNNYLSNLKSAFVNNVISEDEYRERLNQYNEDMNNSKSVEKEFDNHEKTDES